MRTVAHLSDLHFGRHDVETTEALLASLEEQQPDLVIVSGDLTQRADVRNSRRLANSLTELPLLSSSCLAITTSPSSIF